MSATELKAQGNAAYSAGNYDEAIKHYTEALEQDPSMAEVYSNRASAYNAQNKFEFGLQDAEKCISLRPDWAKGYNRKALALRGLGRLSDALECYKKGLELEAGNEASLSGIATVLQELTKAPKQVPKEAAPKESPKPTPPVPELAPHEKEALALKEEGNALYKQRMFDEAMAKYQAACERDPTNTVFRLNCTAVLFEQGEYEKCITACEEALEHGAENKADYTVVAKLLTRKAFCLQKLQRFDEAIAGFNKALVEHRNPDTLNKLRACEKEKVQREKEAYINPEIAQQKKEEGNALFKTDKFPEAVAAYTEAIKRNPEEHTVYSNRAAAYLKLGAYNEALQDAEMCIELKPDFVKAYARKGHAYFWTKQYHKALQAYDAGLKLDAQHAECREGRVKTTMKIQEMASGGSGDNEEVARRAMADPEIAGIMQDSYMQLVLSEMQKDPSRVQDYMRDPNISEKLNKLIAAGIIRFGQ